VRAVPGHFLFWVLNLVGDCDVNGLFVATPGFRIRERATPEKSSLSSTLSIVCSLREHRELTLQVGDGCFEVCTPSSVVNSIRRVLFRVVSIVCDFLLDRVAITVNGAIRQRPRQKENEQSAKDGENLKVDR